jgi:hypothetical protein
VWPGCLAEALHASGAFDEACRAIADAEARLLEDASRDPLPELSTEFLRTHDLARARRWFRAT